MARRFQLFCVLSMCLLQSCNASLEDQSEPLPQSARLTETTLNDNLPIPQDFQQANPIQLTSTMIPDCSIKDLYLEAGVMVAPQHTMVIRGLLYTPNIYICHFETKVFFRWENEKGEPLKPHHQENNRFFGQAKP